MVDAVYDKQTGVVRLIRLSNASGSLYWLPIFLLHFLTYWLPIILAFVIFCNIWQTNFVAQSSLTVFTFILHNFLFVLVMTLLAYCVSMIFSKVNTAMIVSLTVSTLTALIASLVAGGLGTAMATGLAKGTSALSSSSAKSTEVMSVILPWWGYAGGLVGLSLNYDAQVLSTNGTVWQSNVWNGLYVAGFAGLIVWLFITLVFLTVGECVSSGILQTIMAKVFFRNSMETRVREQLELDRQPNLFEITEGVIEDDDVRAERLLANKSALVLAEQATFTDTEA